MPYERDAAAVLADWRAVKRDMGAARRDHDLPGTFDELDRLHDEAKRLRDEYGRLVAEAIRRAGPMLPPFPADDKTQDGPLRPVQAGRSRTR